MQYLTKMSFQKIILHSLKESFGLLWKNKALVALLLALQIAFFVIFAIVSLTYQTKILQSAQAIVDYLNQQKLDEASVASSILEQKNILGDDPLSISRNFNEILSNFRIYMAYVFMLFIIFGSLSWAMTNRVIYRIGLRQLTKSFSRIFAVLLFYLGLIFLLFFYLINISLLDVPQSAKLSAKFLLFFIASAILLYFMFVSLSLSHNVELKNIAQKTLIVGIKKMHYVLTVYFINILLLAIPATLFFYFFERNLLVLFLSIFLIVFSFVFGRIFAAKAINKIGL